MSDDARGFLILCDTNLERKVGNLVSDLSEAEEVVIKTIEDVPSARGGPDFGKQLETLLNWAHGVIIVSSQNLSSFIDKKKTDNLPALLKTNSKGSQKVLEKFLKEESKKVLHKLIVISVDGDKTLPKHLVGKVEIIEKGGDDKTQSDIFANKIKSQLAKNMNI